MKQELSLSVLLVVACCAVEGFGAHANTGGTPGAMYATDAYPGFDSEDKIVNPSKKEPKWFSFWNGPKCDSADEQYKYCQQLVDDEDWTKAAKELDALVREWPTAPEAAPAQEGLARIELEKLDDAEEAFAEYRYLVDYYSSSCDYTKIVDRLYAIAGKMRLDGKTIIFFRFKNTVDVRRAYEACVLRAPGAKWAPQAMLTIGELREEEQNYTEAVKVYENLRNLHYGTPEARQAVARESDVRMKLLDMHGYNRDRTRDTIEFFDLALRSCNEQDQPKIERYRSQAKELLEEESFKAAVFYDSKMRTKRSSINAYERYLADYPDGVHAAEARARLEELKK